MKAHTPTAFNINKARLNNPNGIVKLTVNEIVKIIDDAISENADNVFVSCKADISAQILSIVLTTLASEPYRWGKKRLSDFVECMNATMRMMDNPYLCCGRTFGTVDTIDQIKHTFGIDCDRIMGGAVENNKT